MIVAEYNQENGRHHLAINGHANYGPYGKDIVCAGVSAIVFALLGYIEEHDEDASSKETDSGSFYISCACGEAVNTAFEMALIGLEQIAHHYPDNLYIHISAPGGDSRE